MPEKPPTTWRRIARRIRVPVGFIFAAIYLWLAHPIWKSILCGAAIVIVGLAVRAIASGHLKKNEELATGGPYAYCRNPLYLGSLILALGSAVAALNWWVTVLLALVFVAIYIPVIEAEETFLRARFPEFHDYARAVPRMLPRMNLSRRSDTSFSWDLYLKHREYNATIGSVALIAALVIKIAWFRS